MAIHIRELIEWLQTLPPNDAVAVDNGGLTLVHLGGEAYLEVGGIPEEYDDADRCTNLGGHEWAYTGTAYGGDDDSYHGEGRCYCIHCGADGDG